MHWTQRCKGYKYQSRKCTVLKLQSQQMSRPLPQMITLHPVGQICISLEISSRMKKELSNKQRIKKLRKTTEKAGCETLVILKVIKWGESKWAEPTNGQGTHFRWNSFPHFPHINCGCKLGYRYLFYFGRWLNRGRT